jgi:hypothetical protein
VFDDLLGLEGKELKSVILNYRVMGMLCNENTMLWLLRKKLNTIESFTVEEALMLMNMDGQFVPLLV